MKWTNLHSIQPDRCAVNIHGNGGTVSDLAVQEENNKSENKKNKAKLWELLIFGIAAVEVQDGQFLVHWKNCIGTNKRQSSTLRGLK